jgi:hypothetical protein
MKNSFSLKPKKTINYEKYLFYPLENIHRFFSFMTWIIINSGKKPSKVLKFFSFVIIIIQNILSLNLSWIIIYFSLLLVTMFTNTREKFKVNHKFMRFCFFLLYSVIINKFLIILEIETIICIWRHFIQIFSIQANLFLFLIPLLLNHKFYYFFLFN